MIIQLRPWHHTCSKEVSVDVMTDTWSWIFILSVAGVKQMAASLLTSQLTVLDASGVVEGWSFGIQQSEVTALLQLVGHRGGQLVSVSVHLP